MVDDKSITDDLSELFNSFCVFGAVLFCLVSDLVWVSWFAGVLAGSEGCCGDCLAGVDDG